MIMQTLVNNSNEILNRLHSLREFVDVHPDRISISLSDFLFKIELDERSNDVVSTMETNIGAEYDIERTAIDIVCELLWISPKNKNSIHDLEQKLVADIDKIIAIIQTLRTNQSINIRDIHYYVLGYNRGYTSVFE